MCLTMTPELPLLDRLGKEHIRCFASNRTFNHQRRSYIYLAAYAFRPSADGLCSFRLIHHVGVQQPTSPDRTVGGKVA